MKKLYFVLFALFCLHLEGAHPPEVLIEVHTPIGALIAYRPRPEEMQKTALVAKAIFQEAFATTYTDYHQKSGSVESIEQWLRLKEGLTLESWLSSTFDEEYQEYLDGNKEFIYLCHANGDLIGWLSHSPVSAEGDVYLSQCSLEGGSRNQRVASTVFAEAFQDGFVKKIFPEVKEFKLITRKINVAAHHLYTNAGFMMDETIDPSVYGDCYDERYVGYRLILR